MNETKLVDEISEPNKRIHSKGRHNHCPVCFKAYELIDNELIQSCFHPQNSNICGRCGMVNCNRNH